MKRKIAPWMGKIAAGRQWMGTMGGRLMRWLHRLGSFLSVFVMAMALVLIMTKPSGLDHRFVTPRRAVKPRPPAAPVPTTCDFAVPVLMYHRIDNLTGQESRNRLVRSLTISPEDFEKQMRFLVEEKFQVITTDDIERAVAEGGELPEKAVAVTLDDGYIGTFNFAFPVLRKYRLTATVFLVVGAVGSPGHLSWDDVRAMHDYGIIFRSHTVHHFDLTQLSPPQMAAELLDSRVALERQLGSSVTSLAYPAGAWDPEVVRQALDAGYSAAWRKEGGPVRPGDRTYFLPRVRVSGDLTFDGFKRIVYSGCPRRN